MIDQTPTQAPSAQDGLAGLRAELEGLRARTRSGLVQTIQRAKLLFDPSDSDVTLRVAERDLELLDQQIARLDRLVKIAESGTDAPASSTVQAGVPVAVRLGDDSAQTLTIVPRADAFPSLGFVSSESPVGKALMGRRTGDEVTIDINDQPVILKIEQIGATSDTSSK